MSREVCTSILAPDVGVGSDEMRTPEDGLEVRRLPPGCGTRRIACHLAAESASRRSPNYPLDYRRITLWTGG